MQDLITIDFYGDTILAVETEDGAHFVAVKPICERLGLDWKGQFAKLKADPDLWRYGVIAMPSAGGTQETTCLPISKLAMWLASISPSRVKPEIKDALIRYRNQAADVLDRHFRLRAKELSAELEEARETIERLRWMALSTNPLWGRINAFKEAGVTWLAMAPMLRMSPREVDEILETMTDMGLIDRYWAEKRYEVDVYRQAKWARKRTAVAPTASDLFSPEG
jgi:hypothetical protein